MIRLGFGSTPGTVIVRLGKHSNLTSNTTRALRTARTVSCIWDSRLKPRPRRLRLTTRRTDRLATIMSTRHERILYP